MTFRPALFGLALTVRGLAVPAQTIVVKGGEGVGPAALRSALAVPHVIIRPDTGIAVLRRDTTYSSTVIILGRSAQVAGAVQGDIVVVRGDLFLHPGARVSGRAVAIGGRVYDNALAIARTQLSYPDVMYGIEESAAGYELVFQGLSSPASPPAVGRLLNIDRLTYDRIDGLSPRGRGQLSALTGQVSAGADLAYRSQLGVFDPGADLRAGVGATTVDVRGERGTFTNDGWIHSDLINSVESLGIGKDLRNYFRADRVEGLLRHRIEATNGSLEARVGFRWERDWSAPRDSLGTSAPWSFIRHRSPDGMMRPNPSILDGHLASALLGVDAAWAFEDLRAAFSATEEVSVGGTFAAFGQTTVHGRVDVPTVNGQSYHVLLHAVGTMRDAPPQRWAYLGGAETIATLESLSFGGDELVFVDQQYEWPLPRIEVPVLGAPAVILHYVVGMAGVGGMPPLQQAVGIRVLLTPIYGEILVDPFHRHGKLTAGLSLGL